MEGKRLVKRSKFEAVTAVVMKTSVFWDITLATCFMLVVSSALKMEVTYSSETSLDFERTTRRCIPEDRSCPVTFILLGLAYLLFCVSLHCSVREYQEKVLGFIGLKNGTFVMTQTVFGYLSYIPWTVLFL
jgi:heme O synthase-like polyprenyltransferase